MITPSCYRSRLIEQAMTNKAALSSIPYPLEIPFFAGNIAAPIFAVIDPGTGGALEVVTGWIA